MRRSCRVYTRNFVCLWVTGVVIFLVLNFPEEFSSVLDVKHKLRVTRGNGNFTSRSSPVRNNVRESRSRTITKGKFISKSPENYYQLRDTKVNKLTAEFLISNKDFCEEFSPYLLVVIPSIPTHSHIRIAIRETYGSYRTYGDANTTSSRVLFFFGRGQSADVDKMIQYESNKHKDIVQADFTDSYANLTLKMMVVLKWVTSFCSDIEFMMKVDEDVFVNIPEIIPLLQRHPYRIDGSVLGYLNSDASVRRLGKWAVPREQFPFRIYPTYASGNSYVISGNIISRMFMVSEYIPYMPIEDVFITGMLVKVVGAEHTGLEGFTNWLEKAPDPCDFVKQKRITATKIDAKLMFELWAACTAHTQTCISEEASIQNHTL